MNDEDKGPVPPKPTLPIDMTFNDGHVVSIATYSVLLAISVCGNVTVLCNLTGRKHVTNPRVSIMLIHLAIADLLVSIYSNGIHWVLWVYFKKVRGSPRKLLLYIVVRNPPDSKL